MQHKLIYSEAFESLAQAEFKIRDAKQKPFQPFSLFGLVQNWHQDLD